MRKYLFLDRGLFNPRQMSNVKLQLEKIRKENTVFFKEDYFSAPSRKWEVRYDNGYPNVIYDRKDKIYRCYYTLFIADSDSAGTPLEERGKKKYTPGPERITGLCYACSRDGLHWEKPELGRVEFEGSRRNNILFSYVHGTGVFLDEEEWDPDKRYKLVTKVDYAPGCGYMAVGFSGDGIHFGELRKWTGGQPRADTHNFVFRDPGTGRFILITRIWRNGQRIAAKCESEDFLNWSEPVEIFRGRGFEDQIYSMPVFVYNGLYLGIPSVYHEGDTEEENYDTVDLRLAYSADLEHWEEAVTGENFMERGNGHYPDGEFDCGCIFAAAPVAEGERLYFYYMGGNGRHTAFRETSFSRGYIEKDCFVCCTQKNAGQEAVLTTNPFFFYGKKLSVLVRAGAEASVVIEALDKEGRVRMKGRPEKRTGAGTGTEPAAWRTVVWEESFENTWKPETCTLRIRFSHAQIYGMEGELELMGSKYE